MYMGLGRFGEMDKFGAIVPYLVNFTITRSELNLESATLEAWIVLMDYLVFWPNFSLNQIWNCS